MSYTEYRYVKYKQFTDSDFELTSKICRVSVDCDRSRKTGDQEHTIHSACVSVQRAHKSLFELLRCNDWSYFITLTFGDVQRSDDQYCRNEFMKWRKQMRNDFPSMYYVAVPEYHQSGSIHYHVVVGGISGDQLGFVDSGRVLHCGRAWKREDFVQRGFKVDLNIGEGATIYNVSAWDYGFSTATEIRSSHAVSLYVSKYLTKTNLDPRFFNKKRFYASHNCNRPKVVTDQLPANDLYDPCSDYAQICYRDSKLAYSKYDSAEEVIKARLRGDIPIPQRLVPFDTDGKPVFMRTFEE